MDFLLGIVGSDFVLVVSDKMSARSIMMMKNGTFLLFAVPETTSYFYTYNSLTRSPFFIICFINADMDKMVKLNNHSVMLTSGEVGDCSHFGEYVQKNVQLYQIRHGIHSDSKFV